MAKWDLPASRTADSELQGIASWATLTTLAPLAADTSYGSAGNHRSIRVAGRGRDDNNRTYDAVDATNIINQAQQPYERPSQLHLCFSNQSVSWRRVRLRSQRRFRRTQLR